MPRRPRDVSQFDDYVDDYDDPSQLHEGVCSCESCVTARRLKYGAVLLDDDRRDPIGEGTWDGHWFGTAPPERAS